MALRFRIALFSSLLEPIDGLSWVFWDVLPVSVDFPEPVLCFWLILIGLCDQSEPEPFEYIKGSSSSC